MSAPAPARLKVLVLAAVAHPGLGSEPGMGWNWLRELARRHDLWVLTGEYRDNRQAIAAELARDPELAARLRITFLPWFWPRPWALTRALCRAVPPLYYFWYARWHRQALAAAQKLAGEVRFDLTHQLNMIGYREPGHLWTLGLPHVWGPVGGANNVPLALSFGFSRANACRALARAVLNGLQLRFSPRVARAVAHTTCLVSAFSDCREKFRRIHGQDSVVIPEVGTGGAGRSAANAGGPLGLVWSGRHVDNKCLPLALRALAPHRGRAWTLDVLGEGPRSGEWRREAEALGISGQVRWHGWLEHGRAVELMASGQALLCSSLAEASSTVNLEALSLGLPVVTLDHCGMSDIINDSCGLKVPISGAEETVRAFSAAVGRLLDEPGLVPALSAGALARAEELAWPRLAERMDMVYREALRRAAKGNA